MASARDQPRRARTVHPHTGRTLLCEVILIDVAAFMAWTRRHRPLTWTTLTAYLLHQSEARVRRDVYSIAIAMLDILEDYSARHQVFPPTLTLLRTRRGAILTRDGSTLWEVVAALPRPRPRPRRQPEP